MSAITTIREAENYFHDQIPLTRAMGLRVVGCDPNQFVLEAPVSLNSNHLQTAFGGSINAVATLSAYGLLWSALRERNVHIVVVESSIQFLRPIREMIRAVCSAPAPKEWKSFEEKITAKGKARITLEVEVTEAGRSAARFKGMFLARS